MGYGDKLELASFHTVSKGAYGECGLRGGYFDLMNFHQGTVDEFYKVCGCSSLGLLHACRPSDLLVDRTQCIA